MTDAQKINYGRVAEILVWALLPCIAIWIGMYLIKSAVWAFALYHGLCLIPAIILGRKFWQPSFRIPTMKEFLWLLGASVLFTGIAIATYELIGPMLLSNEATIELLKEQDYSKEVFLPLSLYAIIVNPFFEELYWRGIVLNELESLNIPVKHFAIVVSSLAYAAFHYLIFRLVLFPGWAEIGTLMLAIYGGILAIIYRKTGSILTTALAHGLLTDMAAIALILDLFRKYPNAM